MGIIPHNLFIYLSFPLNSLLRKLANSTYKRKANASQNECNLD